MNLFDILKLSISSLKSSKIRSFLTSLGIIIGVGAVIVIMSVGAGAQSLIINQLNGIGTNLIGILPGASDSNGPPASVFGIVVTTLKYEDALAIASEVSNITAVNAYVTGRGTAIYQNNSQDLNYYGTMSSYIEVEDVSVAQGRFFTEEEEKSSARVVVLGDEAYRSLFDNGEAIGQKIRIKKETFEVIGVLKKRGSAGFQNQDNLAIIPISTAQHVMLGINHVNFIRVKVNSSDNIDQVNQEITLLLRDRHNIKFAGNDDFSIRNTKDAIATLLSITNALKFFLSAIAAISLIVGGIGVMNIMLAAVNERVKEIGLRKAVGARQSYILWQFIFETMTITIFGGLIGIIIGSGIASLVAVIARYLGYNWDLSIPISSIVLGTAVSGLIGLIFGIYPARRASKLDPISALRYE